MKKKIEKHLKGDIKNYRSEIAEDKELIKELKMAGKKSKKVMKKKRTAKNDKALRGREKIAKVVEEGMSGRLHVGSKKGPIAKNPKQALAIAFSESKRAKRKKKK